MNQSVLDAAWNLAHNYPGGAASLAPRIGKNPTTLAHELRGVGSAKLALTDAVAMTALTGDLRVLNAFAQDVNCMVVPLGGPDGDASGSMERVAALAREFSALVALVADAEVDGQISANELKRVRNEWAELQAAGQSLLVHLTDRHQASARRWAGGDDDGAAR